MKILAKLLMTIMITVSALSAQEILLVQGDEAVVGDGRNFAIIKNPDEGSKVRIMIEKDGVKVFDEDTRFKPSKWIECNVTSTVETVEGWEIKFREVISGYPLTKDIQYTLNIRGNGGLISGYYKRKLVFMVHLKKG